jgi:hypothetical protein
MTVVDLEPRIARYNDPVPREEAEALAAKVMAAAADVAKQEAVFLELVGEFDAIKGSAWWDGIGSTAQWLSWACSIAPGTAREHVRVARALRRMPTARQAFATGELTYSKVRELTRVVDQLDEDTKQEPQPQPEPQPEQPQPEQSQTEQSQTEQSQTEQPPMKEEALVEFARACTASQLARSVSGWRVAKGTSKIRRKKQRVAWVVQEDGNVHFTAVLPPEEAASLIAAVQAASDAISDDESGLRPDNQPGQEKVDDGNAEETPEQRLHRTRAEGLVEIATCYLNTRAEDRSGEDRTMVVLEVSADALREDAPERSRGNAEERPLIPTCRVRNSAAIEADDARQALCDSTVVGIITDQKGMPLAVGREQRLVTKHQRRALMIRDGRCQFPGCLRTRRLKAHHVISWLNGGPTDLDNLVLLCQRHHTRVHEDGIVITACDEPDCAIGWTFTRRDGSTIAPTVTGLDAPSPWRPGRGAFRAENDELVAQWEAQQESLRQQVDSLRAAYQHVHDTGHPDARKVFPVGGGEGFNIYNCVDALFHFTDPHPVTAA